MDEKANVTVPADAPTLAMVGMRAASSALAEHGLYVPQIAALWRDKDGHEKVSVVIAPFCSVESKNFTATAMVNAVRMGAVEVVFCVEAWMRKLPREMPDLERERALTTPPSASPERRECLHLSHYTAERERIFQADIERDRDGSPSALSWIELDGTSDPTGRFAAIFAKAARKTN